MNKKYTPNVPDWIHNITSSSTIKDKDRICITKRSIDNNRNIKVSPTSTNIGYLKMTDVELFQDLLSGTDIDGTVWKHLTHNDSQLLKSLTKDMVLEKNVTKYSPEEYRNEGECISKYSPTWYGEENITVYYKNEKNPFGTIKFTTLGYKDGAEDKDIDTVNIDYKQIEKILKLKKTNKN